MLPIDEVGSDGEAVQSSLMRKLTSTVSMVAGAAMEDVGTAMEDDGGDSEGTFYDDDEPRLPMGKKAEIIMQTADKRARWVGHKVVATEDILWAIFHAPTDTSTALKFLERRGLTKEQVFMPFKYSDNVQLALRSANERAHLNGHEVVGSEDLLWAMFHSASANKTRSRAINLLQERGVTLDRLEGSNTYTFNAMRLLQNAQREARQNNRKLIGTEDLLKAMFDADQKHKTKAIKFLERRGVSPEVFYGNAEYSKNVQLALLDAVQEAEKRGHKVVGTEDVLFALFNQTQPDARARHWLHRMQINSHFMNDMLGYGVSKDEDDEEEETFMRMFVVGGTAGVIETFITQPTVYIKNTLQYKQPISLDPRVMYRGVWINAGSIGPISALQYAANGLFGQLYSSMVLEHESDKSIGPAVQVGLAAAAGAVSAGVVAPCELVMISQQRSGGTILGESMGILKNRGLVGLMRGINPTLIRETGWTTCFFGLAPVMKKVLMDDSRYFSGHEVAASAVASLLAGQIAATLTQPADTIKTRMQADRGVSQPIKHRSMLATAKNLYAEGGMPIFFKGLGARSVRCMAAVFILGEAGTRLTNLCDEHGYFMPSKVEDQSPRQQ